MKASSIPEIKNALDNSIDLSRKIIKEQISIAEKIVEMKYDQESKEMGCEYYTQKQYDNESFYLSCYDVINSIPLTLIKSEYDDMIKSTDYSISNGSQLMNIGKRIKNPNSPQITYEEWCNVINENNPEELIFTLHKSFDINKYSIKLVNRISSRLYEIYFNEKMLSNSIDNVMDDRLSMITMPYFNSNTKSLISEDNQDIDPPCTMHYLYYINGVTDEYIISRVNSNESSIEHINKDDNIQEYVTCKEKIIYLENKVRNYDKEIIKTNSKTNYLETTTEFSRANGDDSYGKKKYQNSCKRIFNEEWRRTEFKGGYETKVHRILDDGLGKTTTEDLGSRQENNNELAYEYHDTYTDDISSGYSEIWKVGKDRINEWNSYSKTNKEKKESFFENRAKNIESKVEWYEIWNQNLKEDYCKKWGKSIYEEWEEEWNEVIENGDKMKKCSKKCKKLLDDKEWFETWTEKNNNREDNEKTCYKMNRTGQNKFENFWGDIKVNYLENKRMNYVGFIVNNKDHTEFVDYY